MKLFINYILLFSLSILLFSCEKYLEETPRFDWTEANAIKDYDGAKAALGGIYATFQNDNWSGYLGASLNTKAGFSNFGGVLEYNLTYTQTSASPKDAIWSAFYKSANAANFAIQGINSLPDSKFPDANEKKAMIAEARALRAWVNINLLWNFGHWWADDEFGILYREIPLDLTVIYLPRLSVKESYDKIFADLDYAIENGKDFSTPRYVSKQFAKALKAKILLYKGGYNDNREEMTTSLALVNDVLNTLPASLKLEPSMAEVFNKSWDNTENIFVRYLEDDAARTTAAGGWYTQYLVTQGTLLPVAGGGQPSAGLVNGLDWISADPRWTISTGPVRYPALTPNVNHYSFKKLARLGSYGGTTAVPKDEKYAAYFMRLPELYIMKAELLARTGASIAESIAPINQFRAKRTVPILPALAPANSEELYDLIFKELVCELILENGSEFFAAVRFKNAAGTRMIETIKNGLAFDESKMCWPIPNPEMLNNPYIKQNFGLE